MDFHRLNPSGSPLHYALERPATALSKRDGA
jgi:hypothetical protein